MLLCAALLCRAVLAASGCERECGYFTLARRGWRSCSAGERLPGLALRRPGSAATASQEAGVLQQVVVHRLKAGARARRLSQKKYMQNARVSVLILSRRAQASLTV